LNPIALIGSNVIGKLHFDDHPLSCRLVPDEGQDFTDGVIQVQHFSGHLIPSCQASNPGDDFTGSLPVADNAAGRFPRFALLAWCSREDNL